MKDFVENEYKNVLYEYLLDYGFDFGDSLCGLIVSFAIEIIDIVNDYENTLPMLTLLEALVAGAPKVTAQKFRNFPPK